MFKKSKIKRLLSTAAAAVFMLAGVKIAPEGSVTEADAASAKTAEEITEEMQIGWNLGNSLDAFNGFGLGTETSWKNPKTTQAMIDAVKAKGFNTVRIPTTWYPHLDGNNQIDAEWMARVHEVVDYGISNDMYVILNVHHENWVNAAQFTDETYANAEAKITAIWSQVAEEFKDYDQHLVFEGMNEPRQTKNPSVSEWGNGSGDNGYTWSYINKLNAKFVEAVRGQGSQDNKDRLLMLPGYCASSDPTAIKAIEIPANAGNVALSVHAYLPYYFTMATDGKANHNFPGSSGWGENYEYALDTFFNNMKQIMAEKNAPIVIGEFSASNFDNLESRCNWAKYYLTRAKTVGIPCVLWDNNVPNNTNDGESHGYLDRNACTWYSASEPVIDTMMSIINDDSILWGGKEKPVTTTTTTAEPVITTTAAAEIVTTTAEDVKTTTVTTVVTTGSSDVSGVEVKVDPVEKNEDGVKIYAVDLSSADRSGDIIFSFAGDGGASFNGCLGYAIGEDWNQISYESRLSGDSGNSTVTVALSEIPESVSAAELQIWWSQGNVELVSYNITAVKQTAETTTTTTQNSENGYLAGDANIDGNVSIADAVAILQSIGNKDKYELSEQGKKNADVDGVSGITPKDALVIQQVFAGIYSVDQLPLNAA